MALPIKKFREIVLQILFAGDFKGSLEEDMIPFVMKEQKVTKRVVREACEMVGRIAQRKGEFDALIEKYSTAYGLERIALPERNIMRLALFELLSSEGVPAKSAISEAVRLTRKFGTRDSARFVNAVLDAIYKQVPTSVSEKCSFK